MNVGDFEINLILGIPLALVLLLWGAVEWACGPGTTKHR
jgi:hypothetical protein